jgi:uncharacterized protein
MTTISLPIAAPEHPRPVAPYRHTALLLAILALLAVLGGRWQSAGGHASVSTTSVVSLYLSLLAAEWGLFRFVLKGLRQGGTPVAELIGRNALRARGLLQDCLLGAACWLVFHGIDVGWAHLWGADHAVSIQSLHPQEPLEIALWIAVSISAGFCEELAFRGYCQRQFAALTRSAWLGVLLQAVAFGVGHAYQGWNACLRIMLVGVLLGTLARWRGQLRAGMIGHACTDILAGLFGF